MLDAYGVQVLTDEHLQRATDLSRWRSESLGDDRHLIAHPQLDRWFAAPEPDPDLLQRARADLGPLIVTDDDILQAIRTRGV